MQKIIAIVLAVLIVIVALLPQTRHWAAEHLANISPASSHATTTDPGAGLGLPALQPVLLDNLFATPVGVEAWNTFANYRTAAEKHDTKALAALSYQLSPECTAALADSTKAEPCYQLMDSLTYFTQDFRQKDFTQVAYDEKQIVIATDYLKSSSTTDPVKTVIYFVRATSSPKVLGIRFCVGKDAEGDVCVQTSPNTRDANKNGWWDDVEALFRK